MNSEKGILYLVSTPIGHAGDLSERALQVLRTVDQIICEEYKIGAALLKRWQIMAPLTTLNEHNERDQVPSLLEALGRGQSLALISDCGTPVFADPGTALVQASIAAKVRLVPVPGASSLMAALVCSGFALNDFYYVGFLPREAEARRQQIRRLQTFSTVLVIYEAPYRLLPVLQDLSQHLAPERPAVIAMNLTQPEEQLARGTLRELYEAFRAAPFKGEFVIMIDNRTSLAPSALGRGRQHIKHHRKKMTDAPRQHE